SWSSERTAMPTVPLRAPAADEPADVDRPALATENAGGLFHLGATYVEPTAGAPADERIVVLPLADALRSHAELVGSVHGSVVDWRADRFAALSTAFQNCGAFVHVPAGVALDAPIQLVFANSEAQDEAVFPHVVVVLGAGARASVLERHVGGGEPLVGGIVEVQLGEGAQLDYAVVQQAGDDARMLMARGARCERDAALRWHLADLGAALVRTTLDAQLDAPGAHAQTSALFFNTGAQHVDLTTTVDHRVPRTTSDTVVRSAATDRGQGRYFGNIVIRKGAHGSDASLRDDALLLSKRAHIDSVPALEIAANDVKAFHGATVGSLDETALFYVGSRGIARPEAVRMIALAFFEPAISRFPSEALRDEVRTALDRKIDDATEIDA
ncbi:MAG: Fe-S cluster assembly protein SufD, partial [Candidatus Eremiobacteraeota bacterium]|nr:Fe-S cluster assembly protein SufD [Candidatus Eremiobacteraeota bacterium]